MIALVLLWRPIEALGTPVGALTFEDPDGFRVVLVPERWAT